MNALRFKCAKVVANFISAKILSSTAELAVVADFIFVEM
jgi:hypothetical protein